MYETNKATLSDDYIYEHIELDDDLKPYLNLLSPPPNKIFCKKKIIQKQIPLYKLSLFNENQI